MAAVLWQASRALRRAREQVAAEADVPFAFILLDRPLPPGVEWISAPAGRKLGWGGVPGSNYEGRREGEKFVIHGRGAGHCVGLCQKGAAAMAAEGATFREILARYFPNTVLTTAGCQAKTK